MSDLPHGRETPGCLRTTLLSESNSARKEEECGRPTLSRDYPISPSNGIGNQDGHELTRGLSVARRAPMELQEAHALYSMQAEFNDMCQEDVDWLWKEDRDINGDVEWTSW